MMNADDIQSVHGSLTKTLLKIKGLSENKVEKIKEAAKKCMVCAARSSLPPNPTMLLLTFTAA